MVLALGSRVQFSASCLGILYFLNKKFSVFPWRLCSLALDKLDAITALKPVSFLTVKKVPVLLCEKIICTTFKFIEGAATAVEAFYFCGTPVQLLFIS
ncbi:hypothetical protein [Leptolyngbya sp. KIOST-1]|uniref:hypothetical protein n=1 Tax=Leptolyngbya sp. KIOST-1 TaxID=1229172 RepID=UPI0012E026FC|nr:hypothetical protein [Leptolyngbya sp. KIOST-1]